MISHWYSKKCICTRQTQLHFRILKEFIVWFEGMNQRSGTTDIDDLINEHILFAIDHWLLIADTSRPASVANLNFSLVMYNTSETFSWLATRFTLNTPSTFYWSAEVFVLTWCFTKEMSHLMASKKMPWNCQTRHLHLALDITFTPWSNPTLDFAHDFHGHTSDKYIGFTLIVEGIYSMWMIQSSMCETPCDNGEYIVLTDVLSQNILPSCM